MNKRVSSLLRVAYRNLARNRRRNLATGAAIALGFAALLALGGYIVHTRNFLRVYTLYATRVGHITIYKHGGLEQYDIKPRAHSLTAEDQEKIRRAVADLPDVELSGPQLFGAGLIGNGCKTLPFLATGIDPHLDRALRAHPETRRWLGPISHFERGRGLWEYPPDLGGIAISSGLARLLGKRNVVDDLQDKSAVVIVDCAAPDAKAQIAADANVQLVAGSWSGMMNALDGEVVAHYNTGVVETNNQALLAPIQHLQRLYDTDHVTLWSIWLKDETKLSAQLQRLAARLRADGVDADLYPWTDEAVAPFYSGTLQFLAVMISFLATVLASVVALSVFNTATMTVIERSQEIGMMRSIGYTRRGVRLLFLAEMAILTGLSLAVGTVMAVVGIAGVNAAAIELHPPGVAGGINLRLTPNILTVSVALVAIVSLVMTTTWLAVKAIAKSNIASLVLGTQR